MNTVTATRIVHADLDAVWALISDVTTVQAFHPRVKSVDLISSAPTGVGATRRCNFYDGSSVVEKVVRASDRRSVTLELSEFSMPLRDFTATLSIKPAGEGTQVTFELSYAMQYGILGSMMNALMVRGQMSKLLNAVLAGMDHHLQTGEIVGEDFAAAA